MILRTRGPRAEGTILEKSYLCRRVRLGVIVTAGKHLTFVFHLGSISAANVRRYLRGLKKRDHHQASGKSPLAYQTCSHSSSQKLEVNRSQPPALWFVDITEESEGLPRNIYGALNVHVKHLPRLSLCGGLEFNHYGIPSVIISTSRIRSWPYVHVWSRCLSVSGSLGRRR